MRLAEPGRDNAALCALAPRCPQGQALRFYHERQKFWERCRLHSSAQVLAAEYGGEIVGSLTLACKQLWLGGHGWQPAAYICDLMVAPEHRGRGVGRLLVRTARRQATEVRLFYSYIVEDNHPSRQLFESEGFVVQPRRLLYHLLLPRIARQRPADTLEQHVSGEPLPLDVDAELQKRYTLVDAIAGHDGLFLQRRGRSIAWAALRRHDPQVFVGLPWHLQLVGALIPWLPRAGWPVRVWSLHQVGGVGPEARPALRRLIGGVAWLAAHEAVDVLALPLYDDDPNTADLSSLALTRWGVPPGVARLYLAGEMSGAVLATTRPLLQSGKDA